MTCPSTKPCLTSTSMSDNFEVANAKFKHRGIYFICDFNVQFEVVNPKDDIYQANGETAPDRGQDEINFICATIKYALFFNESEKTWYSVQDQGLLAELCENCLDWCRDTPDVHMQAFKQIKGYK